MNPIKVTCHSSVMEDDRVLTFYCGECQYIKGKPGPAPMSYCYIVPETKED